MNKRIAILVVLSLIFLAVFGAAYTYGLFHSEIGDELELDVADWNIKINNTNVTNGVTEQFTITDIHFGGDSNVRSGKLAPGTSGYFTLAIDPTDTQVSVRYEILIDQESFGNENIKVTSLQLVSGNSTFQRISDSRYVGVIPLSDKRVNTIRINIEWENHEENNETDSIIGTQAGDLEIPVEVHLMQYFGEVIS